MIYNLSEDRSDNLLPGDDYHNPEISIGQGRSGKERPVPAYFLLVS